MQHLLPYYGMKKNLSFCLSLVLTCTLCLAGCGTYYRVSVDSLNEDPANAQGRAYCLQPGNDGVGEEDLLFRDVARTLAPAFIAQGFDVVLPGGVGAKDSCTEARIEYWEEEPRTTVQQDTVRRSHPVRVRDGKHKDRIEYVTIEEPVVTVHTDYGVTLLVTASDVTPSGETRQLWRTSVTCSGPVDSFRTLLQAMIPALKLTLGTRSAGERFFEVFVDDKGKMSFDEL